MKKIGRLAIVAGTGRNSGKTLFTVKLIQQFRNHEIIAVKISRHLHSPSTDSERIVTGQNYTIYRERLSSGSKDSEKMLAAGAMRSYYISAGSDSVAEAFNKLLKQIPRESPVICESPILSLFFNPGLLVVTDSANVINRKEISEVTARCDLITGPEKISEDIKRVTLINSIWGLSAEQKDKTADTII